MKNCKYCQSEINEKAKICPVCKKKQNKASIGMKIIGICIFIFGIGCIFGGVNYSEENNEENEKCYATLEKFNQIKNGMSYEEVTNIIGCEGTLSSDVGDKESYNLKMYYWYAEDNISNMVLMFENNILNGKNQIGLDK